MILSKLFEISQCFCLGLNLLLVLLSEGLSVHPGRLELSTHTGSCGGVGLSRAASDVGGALAALFQPAWQAGGQVVAACRLPVVLFWAAAGGLPLA